jgi:hypothetical protein
MQIARKGGEAPVARVPRQVNWDKTSESALEKVQHCSSSRLLRVHRVLFFLQRFSGSKTKAAVEALA